MRARFFGCGKFGWLVSESEDRLLSAKEVSFLDRHRDVCWDCARREEATSLALNMLRESRLEPNGAETGFDIRVIRRVRLQTVRLSVQYWSPAIFGAAIAAVALVSALQMLARTSELPVFRTGASEARRIELGAPVIPDIPIADRISVPR